jgi:predicted permease
MTRRTRIWRRYSTLLGRNIRSDIEDELKFHIEARARELIDAGWSPRAAEEEAYRLFGDRDSILMECQQIDTRFEQRRKMSAYLSDIAADVCFALRGLRRTPGMTVIMVLTLALGIGATTAIFGVVNAVLLNPLPYANPDQLVKIVENVPAEESFDGVATHRSQPCRSHFVAGFGVVVRGRGDRPGKRHCRDGRRHGAAARRTRVSGSLWYARRPALLGRGLVAEEERPDADVVVLGATPWHEIFGSDPNIIGRTLSLNGRPLTIVGVMPPEFGPDAFWTPFFAVPQSPGRVSFLAGSARLRDGVSLEAASAEINAIGLGLRGITSQPDAEPRFELVRELDQVTERVVPALRMLVVAVSAVLLIVCTNVANLLLVRGTRRQQEIAVRRSLGATRGRIVRLVLAESLALGVIAGAAGVAFALGALHLLKSIAIVDLPRRFEIGAAILPRAEEIALSPSVLVFVAGLVVLTVAVFGVLPALRLSRFGEKGHNAGAQLPSSASNTRVGYGLATVQLALAMTLLIGAGLLLHSFVKLATVDAGFDARGVLSFELVVPGDSPAERTLEVAEALASRLQDHPLVSSAGFIDIPPLGVGNILFFRAGFVPEGMTEVDMNEAEGAGSMNQRTQLRTASAHYLRAIGARLVEGSWCWRACFRRCALRARAQRLR